MSTGHSGGYRRLEREASSHKHTGQSHEKEDQGRLNQETNTTEAKGAKGKKGFQEKKRRQVVAKGKVRWHKDGKEAQKRCFLLGSAHSGYR